MQSRWDPHRRRSTALLIPPKGGRCAASILCHDGGSPASLGPLLALWIIVKHEGVKARYQNIRIAEDKSVGVPVAGMHHCSRNENVRVRLGGGKGEEEEDTNLGACNCQRSC